MINAPDLMAALPTFTVSSAGTPEMLAALTLQAAEQSFPLLALLAQRLGVPELPVVAVESFVHTASAQKAVATLERLFNHHGSDKASAHDYHHLYGAILSQPEAVTAVFEIGLGTNNADVASNMGAHGRPGASLRAFRDYLPHARIMGADVDRRILFSEDRIETYFIDQTDLGTVEALSARIDVAFDLIIDDGLHAPNANLAALLFGLRKLRRGGCFVVEDIHPAHRPVWQVVSAILPAEFRAFLVAARGGMLYVIQRN